MLSRALLATLLLAAPLAAQETLFNQVPDPKSKTRVEAIALFSQPAPGGFLPVRVIIHNTSDKDGEANIATTSADGMGSGRGSEMTSSFKIAAPAAKTTQHDLLVPVTTLLNYYGDGRQNVNVRLSGSFGSNAGSLDASYAGDQAAVLLSESLYTPNASLLDAELNKTPSSRYGSATFAGKFDPRQLPEDWRAYSGYDGLAMTDADWGLATPGARTAILRWNRLGGELVIHAVSGSSDLSTLGISPEGKGVRKAERSFGNVTVTSIGSDLKLDTAATVAAFNKDAKLPPLNVSVREDFSRGWPLQADFGTQGYNYALFILILVAFGILVGPVNLFVFAKSGRRHRLFITTPLIALGTSLLLIALIILIDGFGGRGMRTVLMEVRPDDGDNSAYILQEQVSRTGVLLGGGFSLTEPAVVTPVPLQHSNWSRLTEDNNGGGMRYEAGFKDGKLDVDGDWFQSRSEQGQLVRAIVPTRGRIESRNESGVPSFLSTFDFPIETLFFHDNSGGVWRADHVTPGKAFTCGEVALGDLEAFVNDAAKHLNVRHQKLLNTHKKLDSLHERRGHFVAVTEAAPGIATFDGIKWSKTRTYITGPVAKP